MHQCFTLGTLKNLVCHVWWALQYLALLETNNLYALTPNWQSKTTNQESKYCNKIKPLIPKSLWENVEVEEVTMFLYTDVGLSGGWVHSVG